MKRVEVRRDQIIDRVLNREGIRDRIKIGRLILIVLLHCRKNILLIKDPSICKGIRLMLLERSLKIRYILLIAKKKQ